MALRDAPQPFRERFGPLLLTLDDLREVEAKLPPGGWRSIEAGRYELDAIQDLADSAASSLPSLTMDGAGVYVSVSTQRALVESLNASAEARDAAESVARVFRRCARRRTSIETPARRVATLLSALAVVSMAVVQTVVQGTNIGDFGSGVLYALSLTASLIIGLSLAMLVDRLPARDPIQLRPPPEPWIKRNGQVVALALTTVGIITTIFIAVLTN